MSSYGEPWRVGGEAADGDGTGYVEILSGTHLVAAACSWNEGWADVGRDATPRDYQNAARIVACVNALAGLNPDGVARLLELVHKVVVAAQAARRQGWEDHTNFTQTLELALAACYDGPVTSVPSSIP